MRLVRRQELMTLPAGTLFAELREPWIFGDLQLKGETIQWDGKNGDFWVTQLAWIESDNVFGAGDDSFEAMLADSSVSVPAESSEGRYGLYDDEQVFLVYEPADTRTLIEQFSTARADQCVDGGDDHQWREVAETVFYSGIRYGTERYERVRVVSVCDSCGHGAEAIREQVV